jgi:hypothetical protein
VTTVEILISEAHGVSCPVCSARPGQKCTSILRSTKVREFPHPARVDLARVTTDIDNKGQGQ